VPKVKQYERRADGRLVEVPFGRSRLASEPRPRWSDSDYEPKASGEPPRSGLVLVVGGGALALGVGVGIAVLLLWDKNKDAKKKGTPVIANKEADDGDR
jgi:hypothetical protein